MPGGKPAPAAGAQATHPGKLAAVLFPVSHGKKWLDQGAGRDGLLRGIQFRHGPWVAARRPKPSLRDHISGRIHQKIGDRGTGEIAIEIGLCRLCEELRIRYSLS
jgi:hypothetical protein